MEDRIETAVEGGSKRILQGVCDIADVSLLICTFLDAPVPVFSGEIQHKFVGVKGERGDVIFIILLFMTHIF